jgi:periplasmic protein CpxP/Spy
MKRIVLIATAAVGLTAAVAYAAPFDGSGPMMGGFGGPKMCSQGDAIIAGGLAYAEKRLAITDAQRPAWTKVADAIKAGEPAMKTMCDTMAQHREAKEPPALPERLATMQKMAAMGQEQLARIQPAVAELYAQLTPEQKKTADSLIPRHGPGGRGMMRGDGEHHRGFGPGRGGPNAPAPNAGQAN